MASNEIIAAAKLRIRKTTKDILDEDVEQLIDFAAADLKRIGVCQDWIDNPDAIVKEAMIVYAHANFGSTVNESLLNSYNMILAKIKNSNYTHYKKG